MCTRLLGLQGGNPVIRLQSPSIGICSVWNGGTYITLKITSRNKRKCGFRSGIQMTVFLTRCFLPPSPQVKLSIYFIFCIIVGAPFLLLWNGTYLIINMTMDEKQKYSLGELFKATVAYPRKGQYLSLPMLIFGK